MTMTNQSTEQTVGPLRAAYIAAQESAEAAQDAYDAYDGTDSAEEDRLCAASIAADAALDAAHIALAQSDEPRDYEFSDGGGGTETYHLCPSEVDDKWLDWMATGEWGDCTKTSWVHGSYTDEFDNRTRRIYTLEADEPECIDGEDHDWRSPYSVVGGRHGGGAISTDVCAHCGRYRVSDSWAQDPETGEQGLESTSYSEADEESMRWVRRRLASHLPEPPDGYTILADEQADRYALQRDTDEANVRIWDEEMRDVISCKKWDAIIDQMPESDGAEMTDSDD